MSKDTKDEVMQLLQGQNFKAKKREIQAIQMRNGGRRRKTSIGNPTP